MQKQIYKQSRLRSFPARALEKPIQLVTIGGGGVGKSAVTVRFCTNKFLEEYDPTIEESFSKQLNLDGEQVKVNILDTAGQEEYSALRQQWYRSGDGFLFIFSVAARETFDELNGLHKEISRARGYDNSGIPCVIVANKCDLKGRRQVSSTEARALAKKFGCPLVETSAKTGVNINLAFQQCA